MNDALGTIMLILVSLLLGIGFIYSDMKADLYENMYMESVELIDSLYYTIEEMQTNCTE